MHFASIDDQRKSKIAADVPWTAVERIVGYLLEEGDMYPPRFLAAVHPSDEQLAQLAAASQAP